MGCVLFQQPVGLIPQWSSWLFLKEVHILTWVPHYALHLLCLEYLPFRVWHNFLSPFISESCSHIAQSESYFTHQTTHTTHQSLHPLAQHPTHTVSINISKNELFLEKRALWAQREWFMEGIREENILGQKSVWWEVSALTSKGPGWRVVLPTHLLVE